ncbi:helix-turn-helix domain-containing protein [Providencia sp. Je.9.19]|uniref:helix-turn-helix domain-containing protein n=1 Tax=Providencia sp. Je.9.19 TaxID=3142844 RepID=UPI003DA99BFB
MSNLKPEDILGQNIRECRRNKGFSGSDLASIICCSQQHISRIESGSVRLNVSQIKYIADCLDTKVDSLIFGIGFQYEGLDNINLGKFYYF